MRTIMTLPITCLESQAQEKPFDLTQPTESTHLTGVLRRFNGSSCESILPFLSLADKFFERK